MSFKMPSIHPIRLAAIFLLAGTVAYSSYHFLKPQTFSYVKVKDGVVVEGGTALGLEQVEKSTITVGDFWQKNRIPIPGIIPWSEVESVIGLPVTRQVHGGVPLLLGDIDHKGKMDQQITKNKTGMSIPVDNVVGVTPQLSVGEKVHIYASFEDEEGSHTGLLLRGMPVISLQREIDGSVPTLTAVTVALTVDEAVLLIHALHYGKIHLGKAALAGEIGSGVGDPSFAKALMKTKKRWDQEEKS